MGLARNQHTLLQHLQAGVSGYVLKDDSLGELLWSIRAAHHSEAQVAPPLAAKLMAYLAEVTGGDVERRFEFEPECGGPETLSRREREVLALIQRGLTNQEIAESLVIELGTVKNHVHNILRKHNVNSRRDAAHAGRLAGVQWRPSGTFVPAAAHR
jgi:DNA-binding NarL/FixJ family response regulator